ncbi:MAG: hypothetical protein HY553_20960 [Elusimicrobia bacterium]|nr:hypothetical protein [Elusimicrobiota bacterium]
MNSSRVVTIITFVGIACNVAYFAVRGFAVQAHAGQVAAAEGGSGGAKKSAAELEKEKAMQHPYPNDFGPEELDVSGYPKNHQEGYKMLKARCAQCHSSARPLNSRFVEPDVAKDKKQAAVADLKKSQPELFKDPSIWQVEANIWERYVKRMMAKPGCKIDKKEGKAIWEFLVYDGKRKIGANAGKWKAHREKLINELKSKKPERYKELHEQKDL